MSELASAIHIAALPRRRGFSAIASSVSRTAAATDIGKRSNCRRAEPRLSVPSHNYTVLLTLDAVHEL
jgi:hypothetical protein